MVNAHATIKYPVSFMMIVLVLAIVKTHLDLGFNSKRYYYDT